MVIVMAQVDSVRMYQPDASNLDEGTKRDQLEQTHFGTFLLQRGVPASVAHEISLLLCTLSEDTPANELVRDELAGAIGHHFAVVTQHVTVYDQPPEHSNEVNAWHGHEGTLVD